MNVKEPKMEIEEEDFDSTTIDNLCEDMDTDFY